MDNSIRPSHLIFLVLFSLVSIFASAIFHSLLLQILGLSGFMISFSTLLLTFIEFPLRDLPIIWGFGRGIKSLIKNVILWGIIAAIFGVLLMYGLTVFHLNDTDKVYDKVSELPVYVLLYAILLAPIVEEIFFRRFLPQYIGGFLSSFLFALAHVSYGSVGELLGAFYMGYVFYMIFRFTRDLRVPIVLHAFINLLSVISVVLANW